MTGKVVVERAMPADGFVAAPGDSMDRVSATTSGTVTAMRFRAVDRCAG